MKNLHRIIDYTSFKASINQTKRKKLVDHIKKERTNKLPEHKIEVMPLYGWDEDTTPRRDEGEIRAIVRIQDVVFIVFDNLTGGEEDFHCNLIDEDILDFIGAAPQPTAPMKKDGTPFAGFNGGRRKRELTDEEQARISEMRKAGHSINAIARELHISNRVISEFVKTN